MLRQLSALYLLATSDLFDKAWYLANNKDVPNGKISPFLHFLNYGGFEGRDPGPRFNSSWYMETYQDVKNAGINPLVHFLRYGRKEGRIACPQDNIISEYLYSESGPIEKLSENFMHYSEKQKVFCIGLNKTGTTSIAQALENLGYVVGSQPDAERLMDDWMVRDFRRIVQYCETADAFQDVPFSLDFTYQVLDFAFPDSKFILTIRSSSDDWYQSLIRFHSNLLGIDRIPTADDLKKYVYHEQGYLWRHQKSIFGVDEESVYDEQIYKNYYENHNFQILEYFRFRPKDLLVLNLGDSSAMQSLCDFLDIKYTYQEMPHLHKSVGQLKDIDR